MTNETQGLSVRERDPLDLALRFVIPLDELRVQLAQLEEFKRDIMVEGVDYGVIPGTPKPTLLKPGAEKLALAFGLSPIFTVTNKIEDWEHGFFYYEVSCDLFSKRTGERVANGIGSANSKESRYRWRDAKPTCPDCGFELRRELRRSQKRDGDQGPAGWYCWGRLGGCGAEWPVETVKVTGRVENQEPYELVNTLVKMGQKRSLTAAVLIGTGGSGIWTMDLEDMPRVSGEVIDQAPRPRVVEQAPNGNTAGRAQQSPPPARPPRQASIPKPTETRCSVCEKMVESESLLKTSRERFTVAFCAQHFNEAMNGTKPEAEKAEESPF